MSKYCIITIQIHTYIPTHMPHSREHLFKSIATLTAVLGVVFTGQQTADAAYTELTGATSVWQARLSGATLSNSKLSVKNYSPQERIALRLQSRLRAKGTKSSPTLSTLTEAVTQRQKLLQKQLRIAFITEEDSDQHVWDVSAQRYPLWIKPEFSLTNASFSLDTSAIVQTMNSENILSVDVPTHAVLKRVDWNDPGDTKTVSRAEVEGYAKPGYLPDYESASEEIAKAFATDMDTVSIPLKKIDGRIINMTGEDLGDLVLWATGKSDYKGSTYARTKNVQKALNEHVNNTIVRPGENFAFNSTLDGLVSQGNGWHMAKVIYNGGDLEYAPGGGICQASTTVYRAAVNAGFPVVARRAHSLYVSYYEKYGVGIDATIYPGSQDLVFTNDTASPLLIQSYNDGTEAYVNIFGSPDGRTVELNGPFFASNAPEGIDISSREILWEQRVTYPSGEHKVTEISSRYKTLPKYIVQKYEPTQTVHASAPVASVLP